MQQICRLFRLWERLAGTGDKVIVAQVNLPKTIINAHQVGWQCSQSLRLKVGWYAVLAIVGFGNAPSYASQRIGYCQRHNGVIGNAAGRRYQFKFIVFCGRKFVCATNEISYYCSYRCGSLLWVVWRLRYSVMRCMVQKLFS